MRTLAETMTKRAARPRATREAPPPKFTMEVARTFTGVIQMACNGPEKFGTPYGEALRGQVIAIAAGDEQIANAIVKSGQAAHVAASSPLGQPEEFQAKKAEPVPAETPVTLQPPAPPQPPTEGVQE